MYKRQVPMPFTIDGVEFYEGVTIERKEFFDKLSQGEMCIRDRT